LLNFSSYDLIWIVEKNYLILKNTMNKIYKHLPINIPKMGIVIQNGQDQVSSLTFKRFDVKVILKLNETNFDI